MNPFDYGSDTDKPLPTNEAHAELNLLVKAARAAEVEMEKAKEAASMKSEIYNRYMMELIPSAMDKLGVTSITTSDGFKVTVKDDITHSLAAERKPAGIEWLELNGHGAVVKTELVLSFAKGQNETADEASKKISQMFPEIPLSQDKNVHASTLKSLIKQLLEKGIDVPTEIFKINKIKKTTIG